MKTQSVDRDVCNAGPDGWPSWPQCTPAVVESLTDVARSGNWWQSGHGQAETLERALRSRYEAAGVVAVANGTLALEVSLRAIGLGPGDEVLVPALTFVSTALAVRNAGATPVPVDIDVDFCLDVDQAAKLITNRTRALIVVHLAGVPADLAGARRLCDERGLVLIEDSAQAIRGSRQNARVCQTGDLATLSFQAAKHLPAGDGGAVIIPRSIELAQRVERVANCGRPRGSNDYQHLAPATNARISEFNAAVAKVSLDRYSDLADLRAAAFAKLVRVLSPEVLMRPGRSVSQLDPYMLLLRDPTISRTSTPPNVAFAQVLTRHGLPARPIYPLWEHVLEPARTTETHCPRSTDAARKLVWVHHRVLLGRDVENVLPQVVRSALQEVSEF